MRPKSKQLIKGLLTFIPGINKIKLNGTTGTDSARYCYSVWLRHLVLAHKNGYNYKPKVIAEFGPGDSLGIGLCAVLMGVDRYYALDFTDHASVEINLAIFEDLVNLFRERQPIPDEKEFPTVKPHLDDYAFPEYLFNEGEIGALLIPERIEKIKKSIKTIGTAGNAIAYATPWFNEEVVESNSLDMILSQAVMEHVDQLELAYNSMSNWLRDTGFVSHQIDFKSHQTASEWNGHWTFSDFQWKLIRGKRKYLINREPCSTHLVLMKRAGLKVDCLTPFYQESKVTRSMLAPRFSGATNEDMKTASAFVQASKIKIS